MKIYSECEGHNFKFWAYAKENSEHFTDSELDRIFVALEEVYPDGADDTTLNDIMWFEPDFCAELIGKDWEEMLEEEESE